MKTITRAEAPIAPSNSPSERNRHQVNNLHQQRPGILLTMGGYQGTLAAARSLGRDGIHVLMADSSITARARWSKWVSARTACPSPAQGGRSFIERISDIGRQDPGHVLYPTSDDVAFLFALHNSSLEPFYRTFQPSTECIYSLLNKKRLFEIAREVDLECPQTWFPDTQEDAEKAAVVAQFPLLLKPQTQIQYVSQIKGFYVPDASALPAMYRAFIDHVEYGPDVSSYDPAVRAPMLQRYHVEAVDRIYSLAGFVGSQGNYAARGSFKVYQRPRRMGVGVCFESAPVDPGLLDKVVRLCKNVGYFGVFEVEFIEVDGRFLLIDFNPRFYGQMGFEIARGLPLARLAYESAVGNVEWVEDALISANSMPTCESLAYCHGLVFGIGRLLSRAAGTMSRREYHKWRDWLNRHRSTMIDAVHADDDIMPSIIDLANEAITALRHPRSFWSSFR